VSGEHDLWQQALDHHEAGDLAQAAQAYQQFLKLRPDHPEALYLLGVVAYQTGNLAPSIELVQRALAAGADPPSCHNALGLAFTRLEKMTEAEASFARAIAIRKAPEFFNNLGTVLFQQGRFEEAIAAYGEALALDSNYSNAHYNLGNAHRAKQELEQAAGCYRQAVNANPGHGHAWAALGPVLHALKRHPDALSSLEKAAALLPGEADLHHEMGNVLCDMGRIAEAVAEHHKALEVDPRHAGAWYSAGCAESSRTNYVAAVSCFRKALEIEPEWPQARHNLGTALFHLGQVDEALGCMRRAAAAANPEMQRAMIAVIIPGSPKSDNRAVLAARLAFAENDLLAKVPPKAPHRRARIPGKALRVGYVSSFFHRHNWMKPVWGLINHHDRRHFEIQLFSDAPASAITCGYAAHPSDRFHDITGLSNEEVAERIEQSGIDLLVDLNGYSAMRRLSLFALRPAPVIVGWFNMYATTGLRCFDYLIGDCEVIPAEEEKYFCEKIVRVPGSYLTFEINYPVPAVASPPYLAKGAIAFGCLASQYKITTEVVAAWSRILQQAPQCSLILKNSALGSAGTRQFVHSLFREHGISPERLRLEGPSDHQQFLKTYDEIDVALDTFPYNGGTTTTEAIWQGVPVISFWGDRWVARTSASILRAGNLDEFVGGNLEDYVSRAVGLASSPDTARRLDELRSNMRERLRGSLVCDTPRFAKEMERLYLQMCGLADQDSRRRIIVP